MPSSVVMLTWLGSGFGLGIGLGVEIGLGLGTGPGFRLGKGQEVGWEQGWLEPNPYAHQGHEQHGAGENPARVAHPLDPHACAGGGRGGQG